MENNTNAKRAPKVWFFTTDTGAAYDETQVNDKIENGDVLIVPNEGVVGFMYEAWPTAITAERHQFHQLAETWDGSSEADKYRETFELAKKYITDYWCNRAVNGRMVRKSVPIIDRDKVEEAGILSPIGISHRY